MRCFSLILLLPLFFSCRNRDKIQSNKLILDNQIDTTNILDEAHFLNLSDSIHIVLNDLENPEMQTVQKVAVSFYKWYLSEIMKDSPNSHFTIDIIEGNNGKCKLDFDAYFQELRKLGTISEKFIDGESKRFDTCKDYIEAIDYAEYMEADAYDYDEFCIEFYNYNYLFSQEVMTGFEALNVAVDKDNNNAYVDAFFFDPNFLNTENIHEYPNPTVRIYMEKENQNWKIVKISSMSEIEDENNKTIFGYWSNGSIRIGISETNLTILYHGQCVYFYPLDLISDTEAILIWNPERDCKFDNGTDETFDLESHPEKGKPFARYKNIDGELQVEYFYPDWIDAYGKKVNDEVFTRNFYRVKGMFGD